MSSYLPQCLDSILHQTYDHLEIIIVNDCSTDGSREICEQYAHRDSRIHLIHHEKNLGLSAARNTGMELATGEYVSFVDSDDWLALDAYARVMSVFEAKSHLDYVRFALNPCPDSPEAEQEIQIYETIQNRFVPGEYDGDATRRFFFISGLFPCVWSGVYKGSFIAEHRFIPGLKAEDFPFNAFLYCKHKQFYMEYMTDRLYNYRIGRSGQIMSQYTLVIKDMIKGMQIALDQLAGIACPRSWWLADYYLHRLIGEYDRILHDNSPEARTLKLAIRSGILFSYRYHRSAANRVKAIIFRLSPQLYLWGIRSYTAMRSCGR